MAIDLSAFNNLNLFEAGTGFFEQLGIELNSSTKSSLGLKEIFKEYYKDRTPFKEISETYFLGLIDDSIFTDTLFNSRENKVAFDQVQSLISDKYDGLMVFAVKYSNYYPKRSEISEIIRAFNRASKNLPVVLLVNYSYNNINYLSFASIERMRYIQTWREGEKTGKVSLLKDINICKLHAGHERILRKLRIEIDGNNAVNTFSQLYSYWQSVFNVQTLNEEFYQELTRWFDFAQSNIILPFKPDYIKSDEENVQGFLIRLISRLMFSWFLKEKAELIPTELLELENYEGVKYNILTDINEDNFLNSNSYYRGILQNIFFRCLNQKNKGQKKDFICTKYLPNNFKYDIFSKIPYLNGGIFDKLEEDNAKESIHDDAIQIPNYLFYGIKLRRKIQKGKKKGTYELVDFPGINQILKSYKFTIEENTPSEEDIALDPEMLGLVFENLLAELDPQIEESVRNSIRKRNGAYYTPRKVIQEMANESLFLYLFNYFKNTNSAVCEFKNKIHHLVYFDNLIDHSSVFCTTVVEALDKLKILDPACGSGAFLMGMLQRIVQLLKIVDEDNSRWLTIKLARVDSFFRDKFKSQLIKHLDDYSRKLGIIKDSIYGVDIMPVAVQITKLRFFITLLIEQQIDHSVDNFGITSMPNIETKIVCANSLRDIEVDFFSQAIIPQLREAREKYYKPDIGHKEKESIADEIVEYLNQAFPTFSEEIYGKRVKGQNRILLKHWFTHSTIAAPFFNFEFFFPETSESGGFDIVIGNPPYGGKKLTDEIREVLDLESKDPYGAFISRFLGNGDNVTPLANNGVLAYIVSDTFMTIKSHRPLRRQMLNNYIHKIIRVHPDTFSATVNTAIIICERNIFSKELPVDDKRIPEDHYCLMADMTNISIHDEYEKFIDVLYKTEGFDNKKEIINDKYAIYFYNQNIIKTNSQIPFFVSSAKLFRFFNDNSDSKNRVRENISLINNGPLAIREISINNKLIMITKLGNIAEIKHGMTTGDNSTYIYADADARGNYKIVDKSMVLTKSEMASLSRDEWLYGFDKKRFKGKYLVPLDKGGESDSDEGWLPNYYVSTKYYITWDKYNVTQMMKLIGHRHDNPQYYGRKGLTYSPTGVYAPTFRLNSASVFEHKGSNIFSDEIDTYILLGVLCSKIVKYFIRQYINHTIEFTEKPMAEIPFLFDIKRKDKIKSLVTSITNKQKTNPNYNYSAEQSEIDLIIYEEYGLNNDDILEIENWYSRRYPKLSRAQSNYHEFMVD